ncbi:MAG: hypothetical protein ACLTNW_17590 [Mediterraneibacter gnavus]
MGLKRHTDSVQSDSCDHERKDGIDRRRQEPKNSSLWNPASGRLIEE